MKYKNIYVAATGQHVGKTTSTLGLVSAFTNMGLNVGYCKPVGQKFLDIKNLRVDKDTILFAELIQFDLDPEIHSPVIIGQGATERYLDNPDKEALHQRIKHAATFLQGKKDLVIFEGTGHPGVGTVADISNADVAELTNSAVVMIVEGGIGSTIDKMNLCLSLFREKNLPILGVIVNKVWPDKMEKITYYLGKKFDQMGLPLLGVMPYDKSLAYPLMRTVKEAINGEVLYYENHLDNKLEEILAGSLIDLKELKSSNNLLLVVSSRLMNKALKKVEFFSTMLSLVDSPLSGIVITGEIDIPPSCEAYIHKYEVPVVRTKLDTYGAVLKISRIEVKINLETPWKIKRAIQLIEENVDLKYILKQVEQ